MDIYFFKSNFLAKLTKIKYSLKSWEQQGKFLRNKSRSIENIQLKKYIVAMYYKEFS